MHSNSAGRIPWTCAIGAVLFYLPFAARGFLGDDWLWLAWGMRAWADPTLLMERPIYGYFRPLALALVSGYIALAGAKPLLFSAVSLILHACNVMLLYRVLVAYGASRDMTLIGTFLFAFYYLNAPVVAWIATTPDLMVTALSLLLLLATERYVDLPRRSSILLVTLIGMAAVLTKETGFVTVALFFAAVLLRGKGLLRPPVIWHSLALVVLYGTYLAVYFSGRTMTDKELVFGPSVLFNLWYFLAYTLFPLSERVVAVIPTGLHSLLVAGKVVALATVPVLFWAIFRRGPAGVRLFFLWSIVFIATVSLFKWDVSLLSLYPERTASRYMYTANAGMAVVIAWLAVSAWRRWLGSRRLTKPIPVLFALLYLAGNFVIVYQVTQKYRLGRAQEHDMYSAVVGLAEKTKSDRISVLVPNRESAPQIVATGVFLESMLLVGTGREIEVSVQDKYQPGSGSGVESRAPQLLWDSTSNRLLPIEQPEPIGLR